MTAPAPAHWPLAPSFAPVWGHCSGAIAASMHAPNLETDATREGTAAHWVFSETMDWFKAQQGPAVAHCADMIGLSAPNGVVIDDKMAEGAQVICDDILDTVNQSANASQLLQALLIEHRVMMPTVHPQNGGTLDAALWVPERRVLYIWDYKHGHRYCAAEENLQLIDYVEGIREQLGLNGVQDQDITVVIRIVQPFCYNNQGPVDEWVCKMSDIRGYINTLSAKAHEAFSTPLLTSGKHCRDCPGVGTCTAARQAAYNLIDLVDLPYDMDRMDVRDLAIERQILVDGMLAAKARLEAIEDDLHHRIGRGEAGSGLTLESGTGRLAWTVPPAQAAALASQFGFNIKKEEVKTPTQAIQAAPKAVRSMFEQVLKTAVKRPATGLKLIKLGDSKTALAFQPKK